VLLASATPSLESWHLSRPATEGDGGGRYQRLLMPSRIGAGIGTGLLPKVRRVDMNKQPRRTILSAPLVAASIMLTLRIVGDINSLLVASVVKGEKGDPGPMTYIAMPASAALPVAASVVAPPAP
jgi:hypothetical protein